MGKDEKLLPMVGLAPIDGRWEDREVVQGCFIRCYMAPLDEAEVISTKYPTLRTLDHSFDLNGKHTQAKVFLDGDTVHGFVAHPDFLATKKAHFDIGGKYIDRIKELEAELERLRTTATPAKAPKKSTGPKAEKTDASYWKGKTTHTERIAKKYGVSLTAALNVPEVKAKLKPAVMNGSPRELAKVLQEVLGAPTEPNPGKPTFTKFMMEAREFYK